MLGEFYEPFHNTVAQAMETTERPSSDRLIGADPTSGRNIYARMGRFGAFVQIGENADTDRTFANLRSGLSMETVTIEKQLECFKMPRTLGEHDGQPVKIGIGRFGPYAQNGKLFASLTKEDDPYTITYERAVELIEKKKITEKERNIKIFDENPDVKILKGRWGPFIAYGKINARIPKDVTEPATLSYDDTVQIILQQHPGAFDKPVKKAAAKKATTEKKSSPAKKAAKKAAKKSTTSS